MIHIILREKLSSALVLVPQVGNLTTDVNFWGTPEQLSEQNMPRPAYMVYTRDGTADLASSIATALASGSMALRSQNASYSQQLMTTATSLYNEAKAYPGLYTSGLKYSCTSRFSKANVGTAQGAQACPPPTDFANGTAAYFYNSTGYWDDLIFAAGWMFQATNDSSYMADVNSFYASYNSEEAPTDVGFITDYNHVFQAANVLLAVASNDVWYHQTVQTMLQNWICALGGTTAFTPQGRAWNPLAPTTGDTGNVAFLAAVYGQFHSTSISAAQSDRYICFARSQMRYILGDKTNSLMVGNGVKSPTHAQNRAASCPNPPTVCNADDALYVSTPNPHVLTGAVVEFATFSDNYQDVRTSNDSRVSITNNAGITGTMAGLVKAPGTWDSCLQGFGVLTGSGGVCKAGNVVSA
ncbi:hypothetical protein WJX73_005558 [Symbiochloris irregularis]|uniref:cellulase n=1 Tax=Symbiochloris irregularis TaxID=706552 RepID=A0AAW1P2B9_9CHLO